MAYEALLFDMDGTLIDSEPLYFAHMKARLRTLGKDFSDDLLTQQVGKDLRTTAPAAIASLGLDMGVDEYLAFLDIPSLFKNLDALVLMPGVLEALDRFKGRAPMAIATGSPLEFIGLVKDKFHLHPYFDASVSSAGLPLGKPAPDVYLAAARALGADPARCIVVEDAPAGVLAGKAAGAYTVAVPTAYTRRFDFSAADYVCGSMGEAARHIGGIL